MSAVVTVMNMKGGVGKTTTTVNLASLFAVYHVGGKPPLRVLAIDYDPQFNLSQACLQSTIYFNLEKQKKTILSVLLESGVSLNPYQLQVPGSLKPPSVKSLAVNIFDFKTGKFDLVPSTLDLMYVALGQATVKTGPIEERFENLLKNANYFTI